MREIRLRWSDHVSHKGHEVGAHAQWARATAEVRRDLEIIVKTANGVYGPRSHWIEEREARRPDRKSRLRFDQRVLQGDAAASPYARQLVAGFTGLRFETALEREYADHVHDVQRHAALMCVWLALVVCAVLGGVALWQAEPSTWSAARWAVVVVLGAGVFLLSTRSVFVRTDVLALAMWLPMALFTGLVAFLEPAAGVPYAQFAALLVSVAAFFPIGLVWRQSLWAALGVTVACALAALVLLPPEAQAETPGFAGVMFAAVALAAVGGYFRERLHREQFLIQELLSRQAHVDPLTGLQNRRGTDHLTQIARLQALRDGVKVSFIALEIDHFRHYNDHYGRDAGDATLMEVTKILSSFARRPLDVASRLGGKAFGVLLYDCNLEQAGLHAERLRQALHDVSIDHVGSGSSGKLTVSMGAVELRPDERAEDFYRRADRLLAISKQAGRDRVTVL